MMADVFANSLIAATFINVADISPSVQASDSAAALLKADIAIVAAKVPLIAWSASL